MKRCEIPFCVEHDDEGTHMGPVIDLPGGWTVETAQMAGEDDALLHLVDPRGLVHAALVPGLSPDEAVRFGAAVMQAGLAAARQNPAKSGDVVGSDDPSAFASANCETGADYDRA